MKKLPRRSVEVLFVLTGSRRSECFYFFFSVVFLTLIYQRPRIGTDSCFNNSPHGTACRRAQSREVGRPQKRFDSNKYFPRRNTRATRDTLKKRVGLIVQGSRRVVVSPGLHIVSRRVSGGSCFPFVFVSFFSPADSA